MGTNLAVIPARAGSQRIPRKSIRMFCGKPALQWSIEAASASGCFDRIVVSTDDTEIAEIASSSGAEIPFIRPAELADSFTGTVPVIAHAIEAMRGEGCHTELVCCIYPVAPFVRPVDIQLGLELIRKSKCDFAVTVTSYAHPIQRALQITKDNRLRMLDSNNAAKRSQDFERCYHDVGQFYWGKTEAWSCGISIFESECLPIVLPRHLAHDIDTEEDWKRAELIFKALIEGNEC